MNPSNNSLMASDHVAAVVQKKKGQAFTVAQEDDEEDWDKVEMADQMNK